MKLSDFDYDLPPNLIAQKPQKPRDHSRLLILDRAAGAIQHQHFYQLIDFLKRGDTLVLNNSKVFPARLLGTKAKTSGKIEVFLLSKYNTNSWECLLRGNGQKENLEIKFAQGLSAKVLKMTKNNIWLLRFNKVGQDFMETITKIGQVPLPPYIKRIKKISSDQNNYQTVFANDKKVGSVAAPTAGLHFTDSLLEKIKQKGVHIEYVTLHVGLGTFLPVKTDNITDHEMHQEYVEVRRVVFERLKEAKNKGKRIIAVGTTSARALESLFSKKVAIKNDIKFWTNIFIYPGYKFKIVDGIITNFHLPKSTLLMLISAMASREIVLNAYQEAIKNGYRFYSYGDAMFIT